MKIKKNNINIVIKKQLYSKKNIIKTCKAFDNFLEYKINDDENKYILSLFFNIKKDEIEMCILEFFNYLIELNITQ